MHVPDGFFDAPTSVATGVVSGGSLVVAAKLAGRDLDDRLTPMAGLVAAFIFALQMLNFPVAAGTSGHLLGGALAAVLVGPWVGMLSVSIVVFVQAVVFADGGLSALGLNAVLIAIVPALVGYGAFRVVRALLPASRPAVVAASALGALVSVPVAAATFALLFAIGGQVDLDAGSVLGAMVGTHVLIGIGEAIITGLVVSAVVGTRPDLVHGAQDLAVDVEVRPATLVTSGSGS